MRYYEVGTRGNLIGPAGLACPICGNSALSEMDFEGKGIVSFEANGGLVLSAPKILQGKNDDIVYKCPQCAVEMIPYDAIRLRHSIEEHCPGCIVCGGIRQDVVKVCTECVMSYGDTARGGCDGCSFKYSRIQMGIELEELKEYYGVCSPDHIGEQQSLFDDNTQRRKWYVDRTGTEDTNSSEGLRPTIVRRGIERVL